ncbi:hypothetical protein SNE40_019069 [Patella caerulea]|uniref:PEST proteolytic signal-containing nuclear protein n=1 Tax=Patella caerulea TaxID=87958 RepID=A0AAN8PEA4_PATCE
MADKDRLCSGPQAEDDFKSLEKRPATGEDNGPPAKKISMNFKSTKLDIKSPVIKKPIGTPSIKMSLGSQKPKESPVSVNLVKKSGTVAKAFNSDSESDEEEMPPEAKMRMKNVGRDTPTAAGPNSFGKGKLGFTNHQRLLEKTIAEELEKAGD